MVLNFPDHSSIDFLHWSNLYFIFGVEMHTFAQLVLWFLGFLKIPKFPNCWLNFKTFTCLSRIMFYNIQKNEIHNHTCGHLKMELIWLTYNLFYIVVYLYRFGEHTHDHVQIWYNARQSTTGQFFKIFGQNVLSDSASKLIYKSGQVQWDLNLLKILFYVSVKRCNLGSGYSRGPH